jgi:hypothetical protein
MVAVDIVLACCVAILFAVFVKQCVRIERCEDNMGMSEAEIQELRRRCDAYKELIEALSKSVRELNGVVEEAVNVKEQTSDNKPDTKALIGGWTTDGTKITWLDDILAKIRKEKEKPADTYYLGVGVDDDKMLRIPVRDTGQTLVDGEPIRHGRLWTNSEGRIYELPEGCYISGDTSYEMDQ